MKNDVNAVAHGYILYDLRRILMEELKFDINNIDEYINKAAVKAANEAFTYYQMQENNKGKNKYICLTEELLRNYNNLNSFTNCNKNMDSDYRNRSIIKDKVKAKVVVNNFDRAWVLLKLRMMGNNMSEKIRAIELIYFEDAAYKVAAIELICDKSTVRRWINEMIEELSILLWGIDGLMIDV
jgi:hypothetical protein